MNILIAPNSFKECADSVTIAKIIAGVLSNVKDLNLVNKPLSDGGDGFLSIIDFNDKIKTLTYLIKDDYSDDLKEYRILYSKENKTIWIESAQLFGLKIFRKSELNPLKLNSELLGKLLSNINEDALCNKIEVEQVFIGVGGTATIDFGLGACSQMGLSFYDNSNQLLKAIPENFNKVSYYSFVKKKLSFKIKCIVDVNTQLFGNSGAIEIYGKQKGASDSDLIIIKSGIKKIFNLISKDLISKDIYNLNGSGGGLAAGLNLFFDAEIIPAKDFIKNYIFAEINDLDKFDAVITGEGRFDFQSFEGKGCGVIINLFKEKNIPIFLINGSTILPSNMKLPENVTIINIIDFFGSTEEAIINFKAGITKATQTVTNYLKN